MPATNLITAQQFSRRIGLPDTPAIVGLHIDDVYCADARLMPGALRRHYQVPADRGKSAVVVCQRGRKLSEGSAARLRHEPIDAQTLEGDFAAWKKAHEMGALTKRL
jgi:hypothetical protein